MTLMTHLLALRDHEARQQRQQPEPMPKPFDGLSDSQVAAVDEQIDLMEEA